MDLFRPFLTALVVAVSISGVTAQAQEEGAQQDEQDEPRIRRLRDSLAIDPETEWVPNLDTSSLDAEIQRKLGAANRAFEAGDLTSPPQANALYYFRQVLDVDPDNAEANQGVGRVADQLVAEARAAQAAGDRNAALAYVQAVKSFRPDYPGLATLEDELSRRAEIEALLTAAEAQFADSRLTQPAGDNALETFREVLAIDAGHARAQAGLERIESAPVARAESAIGSGDFDEASTLIERASEVRGGSEAVTAARDSLVQARNERRTTLLEQARSAVEAGDLEAGEALLDQFAAGGFEAGEEVAAIREEMARIERIRAYPAGSTFSDDIAGGGSGPVMTVVPAGSFTMGSGRREADRSDNEGPEQEIRFAIPFALGETEITVEQFGAFVAATDYVTDAERAGESTIYNVLSGSLKTESGVTWRQDFQGQEAKPEEPVVHVSWNDATAYAD